MLAEKCFFPPVTSLGLFNMVPHFGNGVFYLVKFRLLGGCTVSRKERRSQGRNASLWNYWCPWNFTMPPLSLIVIVMTVQVAKYGYLWYTWYLDFNYSNYCLLKVNSTYMKESFKTHLIPIRLTADLSAETLQARREGQDIFKVMKGTNLQPRLLPSKNLIHTRQRN